MDIKVTMALFPGMVFQRKDTQAISVVVSAKEQSVFGLVDLRFFQNEGFSKPEIFVKDIELCDRNKYIFLGGFWEIFQFKPEYETLSNAVANKEG